MFLKYRTRRIELGELHKRAFALFLKGFSEEMLIQLGSSFAEKYWQAMQYEPAISLLKKAKEKKHYTIILSSSPTFLVAPFAAKLQVSSCKGAEYLVDKEQRICEISSLMLGKDKAEAMHAFASAVGVSKDDTIAYSDSFSDLSFLESAGKAVAVNPDQRLRRISLQRGWEIF